MDLAYWVVVVAAAVVVGLGLLEVRPVQTEDRSADPGVDQAWRNSGRHPGIQEDGTGPESAAPAHGSALARTIIDELRQVVGERSEFVRGFKNLYGDADVVSVFSRLRLCAISGDEGFVAEIRQSADAAVNPHVAALTILSLTGLPTEREWLLDRFDPGNRTEPVCLAAFYGGVLNSLEEQQHPSDDSLVMRLTNALRHFGEDLDSLPLGEKDVWAGANRVLDPSSLTLAELRGESKFALRLKLEELMDRPLGGSRDKKFAAIVFGNLAEWQFTDRDLAAKALARVVAVPENTEWTRALLVFAAGNDDVEIDEAKSVLTDTTVAAELRSGLIMLAARRGDYDAIVASLSVNQGTSSGDIRMRKASVDALFFLGAHIGPYWLPAPESYEHSPKQVPEQAWEMLLHLNRTDPDPGVRAYAAKRLLVTTRAMEFAMNSKEISDQRTGELVLEYLESRGIK
jgi:hypothetical protein